MIAARCPWYFAGPLLGFLMVALRVAVNRPLGALGGYIDVVDAARGSRRLGFSAFLLLGTVLGGSLFSFASGGRTLTWSYQSATSAGPIMAATPIAMLVVAGLAMGVGARTAGGCTSGHGLSGMSLGSPASVAGTITFFATAVALANVVVWLMGGLS